MSVCVFLSICTSKSCNQQHPAPLPGAGRGNIMRPKDKSSPRTAARLLMLSARSHRKVLPGCSVCSRKSILRLTQSVQGAGCVVIVSFFMVFKQDRIIMNPIYFFKPHKQEVACSLTSAAVRKSAFCSSRFLSLQQQSGVYLYISLTLALSLTQMHSTQIL